MWEAFTIGRSSIKGARSTFECTSDEGEFGVMESPIQPIRFLGNRLHSCLKAEEKPVRNGLEPRHWSSTDQP